MNTYGELNNTMIKTNDLTGGLRHGSVHAEHYRLLVKISGIHSEKVILAMEDYLVNGLPRRVVCEKFTVSTSYLSRSLKKIQSVSEIVSLIYPWYAGGGWKRLDESDFQ